MIILYVTLLYTVVLFGKDGMEHQSNKETTELIIGIHSRSIRLDKVLTLKE